MPTWKNSDGTPVTDPAVLAQLNGNVAGPSVSPFIPAAGASVADASTAPTKQWRGPDGKPVTDPAVLAQLSLGTPAAPALPAAPVDPNALGPDEQRGELAPVIRNTKTGALRLAWPQMALDIGSALTLPGDVASGKTPLDPRVPFSQQDPATLDRAGQLATLVGTGPSLASSGMADALTSPGATAAAQKAATNAAIADAPTSSGLESAASQVFKSSVDTNPLMISDTAYMRFMGDVQDALKKYRPNPNNDPQTVGLLSHLTDLADQANTPGTVVDFKDLHLARQLANQVGQSPGRDGAMGRTVVNQLDSFIKGLSADDILGGTDPFKSANDLANGISTWDRATKVGLIEDATTKADTYPSGMTNGLKITFSQLMRTPDFARFSPVEQQAIRSVAKGTPGQNTLSLLGKLGFSPGGTGAHNILGGALGTALSTAALTPVIGAGPAMVAGPAANMMVSAGARKAAEGLALKNAGRAARIAATPNIPTVAPQAISPALTSASKLAEQLDLIRASETNSGGSGGGGGF